MFGDPAGAVEACWQISGVVWTLELPYLSVSLHKAHDPVKVHSNQRPAGPCSRLQAGTRGGSKLFLQKGKTCLYSSEQMRRELMR